MDITIRKALPEDASDYTACHISCWQSAYKGIVTDEYLESMLVKKEQIIEHYKKALTDPGDCEYYCVIYESKMIGWIIINKSLGKDNAYIGEIWAVYLTQKFWGKGHGRVMLDFAVNELKFAKCARIFLWVFEANERARQFYEKHNFSFSGEKRKVTRYGSPLVQLKYVLT